MDAAHYGRETKDKHMNFVNNINFITATLRRKKNLVLDLSYIVYRSVGSTVNLDNVGTSAFCNFKTLLTMSTRRSSRTFSAV